MEKNMTSKFAERLAAAKAAPRPTKDVVVTLDAHVAAEFEKLRNDLEKARQEYAKDIRLAAPAGDIDAVQEKLDALRDAAAESLVKLRFTRLPGDTWADIADRSPARLDAAIDRFYGYNMHTAVKLAAPLSGVRVEGEGDDEEEIPLTVTKPTDTTPGTDEWADLFAAISGAEMRLIYDAVYDLNVHEPIERVDQLKKDSVTRPA